MHKFQIRKFVGTGIVLLLVCGMISIPIVNNYSAAKISRELCELPLPKQTKLIDSVSKAGKLVGNGNGMQFFGAILIKSELTFEELRYYYGTYQENELECIVEKQEGKSIDLIEHETLQFSEKMDSSGYYIVYSWGDGISLFEELDIRGH